MIGLGIVVRGRVQVPSLNAGINLGGLIWVGTSAGYWHFSDFSVFWPLYDFMWH